MEFKHKRGSALILFDKIMQIPILIIAIIVGIVFLKEDFSPESFIPILFIIFNPLFRIFKYVCTFYTIEDDHLIIETGILNRKRKEIPFRVITTVDLSQNILFQFFNIFKIKIDNASQTNDVVDKSDLIFALKSDEALLLKQIITQSTTSEEMIEKDSNIIKASSLDFIKHGLLQSKFIYVTGAAWFIFFVGSIFSDSINAEELFDNIFERASAFVAIGSILFIFLVVYFIATSISIIKSVVKYYNFSVSGDLDSLRIEYGLFNKKKFTLQKSKINGIILKQNLLMRLFKYYTAEILVIGYGDKSEDEAHEQAIIYPIASMEKIEYIINELLPDFEIEQNRYKPTLKAIRYFFYNPVFVAPLIILLVSFFTDIISIFIAVGILVFATLNVVLQYINSSIISGEKNIVMSFGSFHKKIAIVKTASVENITAMGSIWKRKNGIVSINLGFVAPKRASTITAHNLPIEQFKILENTLNY